MPLTFKHHQLANGLDILAEINPDSHSFAAGFFVKTGSRDESTHLNGVSHFLEHMMFKGSTKYGWADVNRIFDEMGARYNAFTTQEMTAYYANVIPQFTERAIEHLSHLLRPAIRVDDFTTEKKVILEEIAMYLDEPGHVLYEKLMEAHFGKHPLSQSILGSSASIQALDRDEMAAYFAHRYGPGNMVLAVTGKMDFDQVVAYVENYCGAWNPVDAPRSSPAVSYHNQRLGLTDAKLNRMYTMAMTPGPSAQDERRFAARILSDVIGDAEGSRLYWALVETAIADEADFSFYPHDGMGSFMLSLTTSPDKTSKALDLCLAELERVKKDLNDAEVERAKNKIASSIVLGGELPIGRMRSIGSNWVYTGKYRSLEEDMATLMKITPSSLQDLLREFTFDPMTIVSLGPAEK